jgi:hypothetical protein
VPAAIAHRGPQDPIQVRTACGDISGSEAPRLFYPRDHFTGTGCGGYEASANRGAAGADLPDNLAHAAAHQTAIDDRVERPDPRTQAPMLQGQFVTSNNRSADLSRFDLETIRPQKTDSGHEHIFAFISLLSPNNA